jgi:DNA-binding NtrC family response regulator
MTIFWGFFVKFTGRLSKLQSVEKVALRYALSVSASVPEHFKILLTKSGYAVSEFSNLPPVQAQALIFQQDTLPKDVRSDFEVPCIILSGSEAGATKLKATYECGAKDPWIVNSDIGSEDFLLLVAKACVVSELAANLAGLKNQNSWPIIPGAPIAASAMMQEIMNTAVVLAKHDSTILLTGESGTGKTAIASFIHRSGNRINKPFVSINCAAMPRELMEAEFFGFERGAFTGANARHLGAFERADGGTLFLDEIGDLPLDLQPKLLTVLQDKFVQRLGSDRPKKVDVRIIAATNRDLLQKCTRGEFRQDLFFRINVIAMEIPPLRKRPEDILALAQASVERLCGKLRRAVPVLSAKAQHKITSYHWPGNVRELENTIERTLLLTKGDEITAGDIELSGFDSKSDLAGKTTLAGIALVEIEAQAIRETMQLCAGDKKRAAALLGISIKTLYNKLNAMGTRN